MNFVITGGCGFIGANFALKLRATGDNVTVFDSLGRAGSEGNLALLESASGHGPPIRFVRGDVADAAAVDTVVRYADVVIHLAAQVSMVGGVSNPRLDLHSNVVGTFNVLEGARHARRNPIVLVASTNKVYGGLERFECEEQETRWVLPARPHGIAETEPLDLVTPVRVLEGRGRPLCAGLCAHVRRQDGCLSSKLCVRDAPARHGGASVDGVADEGGARDLAHNDSW